MKYAAAQMGHLGIGALDPRQIQLPKAGKGGEGEAIREVARQFESVFMHQVFKSMRATVPKEGLMSGGFGEQVFTDMLDAQFAELATSQGSSGLAEMLARDLGAPPLDGDHGVRPHVAARGLRTYGAHAQAAASGWSMPLEGRVSSEFGMRKLGHEDRARMHKGLDIAAPEGTPIQAARGGVVEFAGERGGYGNTVVVDHGDGTRTLYAHASELLVEEGQRVRRGEQIAKVGSTGRSTGPHLHFEVRRDGEAVDPAPLLRMDKQ